MCQGLSTLFGGPSSQEKNLANSESQFTQQLQSNYAQRFGQQSSVLNSLQNTLQPIFQAGPSQQGFSPAELSSLNTQAIDSTGAAYKNAAGALNSQIAGRVGNTAGESGAQQAIQGGLASNAAGQLAQQQLGITQANWAQGNQNFLNAQAGLSGVAGQLNPGAYGGLANQANSTAFGQANTINTQQGQMLGNILGDVGGVAGDIAGITGLGGGSPSPANNFGSGTSNWGGMTPGTA